MRVLILLLASAFLAPAAAETCTPTTSQPEVALAGLYVDNDDCIDPTTVRVDPGGDLPIYHPWRQTVVTVESRCTLSLWTYEESNGIEGLQRGDEMHDDTCRGRIPADTLAFY